MGLGEVGLVPALLRDPWSSTEVFEMGTGEGLLRSCAAEADGRRRLTMERDGPASIFIVEEELLALTTGIEFCAEEAGRPKEPF